MKGTRNRLEVQGDLVLGFEFDFRLHKLTFLYGRSRAQLAPTGEAYSQKVNLSN